MAKPAVVYPEPSHVQVHPMIVTFLTRWQSILPIRPRYQAYIRIWALGLKWRHIAIDKMRENLGLISSNNLHQHTVTGPVTRVHCYFHLMSLSVLTPTPEGFYSFSLFFFARFLVKLPQSPQSSSSTVFYFNTYFILFIVSIDVFIITC